MKERITTAYPRSAVMSFGYICVKRERMSLARVLFFSLPLSFLFFPSIYQKVCFDGRVFSSFLFFSVYCFFSSFDELVSGGSYRLHIYIYDKLGHRVWGMPDLREIARWLVERNDVGRKRFDNAKKRTDHLFFIFKLILSVFRVSSRPPAATRSEIFLSMTKRRKKKSYALTFFSLSVLCLSSYYSCLCLLFIRLHVNRQRLIIHEKKGRMSSMERYSRKTMK